MRLSILILSIRVGALTLLLNVNSVHAQFADVHTDASFNLDYFANHGDFEIETPQNGFSFRAGINWFFKDDEKLKLGFETGFSQRIAARRFNGAKSKVKFRCFDFSPVLTIKVYDMLAAEMGLGFSLYDAALYIDNTPRKLGEGYRSFDVYSTAGLSYQFFKYAAIGTRVRYGFIPALHYEPIGDYGEMEGEDSILNQLTFGVFLRVGFYRNDDE